MRRANVRPKVNPLNMDTRQDRNQRYRVEYHDGLGTRAAFGFTDDLEEAHAFVTTIRANPRWRFPSIVDRKTKTRVKVRD